MQGVSHKGGMGPGMDGRKYLRSSTMEEVGKSKIAKGSLARKGSVHRLSSEGNLWEKKEENLP